MSGCKMNPVALGLSLGIIWGLSIFFMGLSAYLYAYGKPFVDAMTVIYFGYEPSIKGSILGGIMGFVNAFISGFLIAWLYNRFTGCACSCCDTAVVEEVQVKRRAKAK